MWDLALGVAEIDEANTVIRLRLVSGVTFPDPLRENGVGDTVRRLIMCRQSLRNHQLLHRDGPRNERRQITLQCLLTLGDVSAVHYGIHDNLLCVLDTGGVITSLQHNTHIRLLLFVHVGLILVPHLFLLIEEGKRPEGLLLLQCVWFLQAYRTILLGF